MKTKNFIALAVLFGAACFCQAKSAKAPKLPKLQQVEDIIVRVNTKWQEDHPLQLASETKYTSSPDKEWTFKPYSNNSPFWDNAAYHTGNIEVCKLLPRLKKKFLDYSYNWAEAAQWKGATSSNKEAWIYKYSEKPNAVLFGDWQICFQTYCDLYWLDNRQDHVARAREVMEYEMSTAAVDYWWWADGLYMVMPVMTKLYRITHNQQYLDKLMEYWTFAKNLMYDQEEHLFYRDGKYVYPKHKSANSKKDFWARGDGWVVAGLAKVLQDLPEDSPYYKEFAETYVQMCKSVKQCQQPEGYWTRSLLDPDHAPGPETSGTAFFTYGLLWGLNNGMLDKKEYLPVVQRSWNYLSTVALQEDNTVGYVQPIGERAIPGQTVNQKSTANFGVGAFLLAACEMYRYVHDFNR